MKLGYDACLSIGFTIDIDTIPDKFRTTVQQFAEPVQDPEEGDAWTFQGKEYADLGDFLDEVARAAGGFHGVYGLIHDDSVEDQLHRIELAVPQDLGDYTCADLAWLTGQLKAVRQIGRKLEELGFRLDPPTAAAYLVID